MVQRSHDGAGPPGAARGQALLSRRRLLQGGLAGAGALALGGLLGGCGPAAGPGGSTVRYWSLFNGGDGALMERMLAEIAEQAPHLRVEPTVLAWGAPYYTKLAMASVGGRAPETGIMHLSRLAGYAPGGLLDPFDLGLLAEFGVGAEHFLPELWGRASHDGRHYAIPLDTHPLIVFYDTGTADRAGLLTSEGALRAFESPEDFVEASRELAEASGDNGVAFGHVNDDAQGWRVFFSLYSQTGAAMELPAGGPAVFDPDAALRVFTLLAEVFDGETSSNRLDYQTALAGFSSGRSGLLFCGEWELPYLRDAVPDLGVAPFPTLFEQPASYADSHSFVLPRQSDPDPERVRAAHEFVALMVRASLTWAEAGHVPAYQPVVESAAYRGLGPQTDYAASAENPALEPAAWFAGAGSDFQSDMGSVVQTALMGAGPEAAVDQLDRALSNWVARTNPTEESA
ncbi:multiple sugar transport system substrate-binding protein [Spinactinospora alkalitolerans]|uniref:Multiple sugar transport system substrate-binding protein n=1 Tax=Spinactinospora alkalitolerans TaxID=687207 RepID=A0A852TYF3_9ACTN|nr:extracellular solute-binding protein [Spinactinospora alkalitolerans]NYE46860.1 multiple sugar transport system substrate-binding protein [Spinactinospora alkalitolerans]